MHVLLQCWRRESRAWHGIKSGLWFSRSASAPVRLARMQARDVKLVRTLLMAKGTNINRLHSASEG